MCRYSVNTLEPMASSLNKDIMLDTQLKIEQRVNIDRLRALYAETVSSILSTLAVMAVFVFLLSYQIALSSLLIWYAVLTSVLLGRAVNYWRFLNAEPGATQLRHWCLRFRLGTLATGIVIGGSSLLLFGQVPVAYEVFNVLVLAGICAGALTVLLYDYIAFYLYINAILLPTVVVSASLDGHLHIAISAVMLIYVLLLMRASHQLYRNVIASLTLGYENQVLAENLAREKKRLDNRLGRILNDSSSEIYIVDADSLQCLQVNQGALQHLGYSAAEIESLSILDVLTELSRTDLDMLLTPLYSGTQESVFYHGHHRRKDGSQYPVEIRLQLSLKESPAVILATALDMTERDNAKRQLVHQANFDQLTDLPNRFYMQSHIEQAFSHARRAEKKVALLFIDLDDFKQVNDSLGHASGDLLLQQAAERIRSVLRDSDTPARLGGDEFLVMLEGLAQREQAEHVAAKLVDAFKQPFRIGLNEVYTPTSIGISLFPDDGVSVEELMQYADTAMYHAKQAGRSRYQLFSDEMLVAIEQKLEVEGQLRKALDNDELTLVYQPKVDARNGRILGAEALLRWSNPALGSVSPQRFIPLAENLGLIGSIGNWVLRQACEEAAEWPEIHGRRPHVAVNVSPHQFLSGRLLDDVEDALRVTGLPVELLELEITENLLIQETDEPLAILNQLREKGIRLSVDDFGTGYSSLSYLKRFPLQILKIDRSFMKDLTHNHNADTLVEAIISMAKSLELDIVAEGVENQQQLRFLGQRGVRIIQGYYFSPPVSAAEFRAMLKKCHANQASRDAYFLSHLPKSASA